MIRDIIGITLLILGVFVVFYCGKLRLEVDGIRAYQAEKKRDWSNIVLVLVGALFVKLVVATLYEGHATDVNCFYAWSEMIFEHGIAEFYYLDAFTDYPPGYMAILWGIAAIRKMLSIETMSTAGNIMIKLVPILADLATGVLVYILAKRKFSESSSLLLSLSYVLNPIVLLDSSLWAQTDSVFTLFVLLTCYLCMEEKRILAYFMFVIGILIKPQTLIFTPILIWTIIEQVFRKEFGIKKMVKDLVGGLSAIVMMVVLVLPFGFEKVLSQYVDTLGSYEYCTVNAYNFWGLLGKNWASQSDLFMGMECRRWGTFAIFAAVAFSAFIFFKLKEDKSKYFISMSVVVSTMFLFSVRMHERYLFPVVALTLCGFLLKPTKELFFTYLGYALVQFMNVSHVLYYYKEFESTGPQGAIIGITALLTLAIYGYMFFAAFSKRKTRTLGEENKKKKTSVEKTKSKWNRYDWIVLGTIMLVYSIFAFQGLGHADAPETGFVSDKNEYAVIEFDLGQQYNISMIHTFLGNYENRTFTLDVSQDGQNYESVGTVKAVSVFAWNKLKVEDSETETYNLLKDYRYIRLTCLDYESVLKELVIEDKDGNYLVPINADEYPELFDEQENYEPIVTFRSGTYFDEIYHARTAYEMIEGIYCYENTHPPLGKFFISLGIRAFGMNPFGWRIVGVLFGIGMLPFIYCFGKRLFRNKTWAAGAATFLFAFDFMHFTQTRISTIDVYGTFFIIAMFYFMYWYSQISFYEMPLWKTFIPLGLSAVMMGLGCASKWTAVYAAAGLAVFFFYIMGCRYREYKVALKSPNKAAEAHIIQVFKKNLLWTLAFCVVFFVVIAGGIYLLSYIPFVNQEGMGLWERMLQNQKDMFNYHSTLDATHPYSSVWYEWPTMIRPMFYYCQTVAGGLKEGISAFGNPLVWWAGIPATIYMVYRMIKKKDGVALFLVFAYLVQMIPWMLVPRCTFAYHYFPSVPFITLMIVYIMVCLVEANKQWFKWVIVYLVAAFVLFVLFYPVLSGQPVTEVFVRDVLRWLPDWVLIY